MKTIEIIVAPLSRQAVNPTEARPPSRRTSTADEGQRRIELSMTTRLILRAVVSLGATDELKKVGAIEIARESKMDCDARLRGELATPRDLQLLGGPKGVRGYWLTPFGVQQADCL